MRKRKIAIGAAVLALALLAAPAPAQPSKSSDADRPTSDVWVRITLKTGAEIEGLVSGGLVYERVEKGKFVPTRPELHRDAGLRLHFVDYNEGYLFIRARDIDRIDSEKTLTVGEQSQIRALVKKRQEASAALAARNAPVNAGAGSAPDAPDSLKETADEARKQLFAKFPPSAGWGPGKRDEILKKRWTVGVFPDAIEREFLDNFEDWMIEYEKALDESTPDGDGKGEGDTPPPLPPPPPADGAGKKTPPGDNATSHVAGERAPAGPGRGATRAL
jgi:hypothetical protein